MATRGHVIQGWGYPWNTSLKDFVKGERGVESIGYKWEVKESFRQGTENLIKYKEKMNVSIVVHKTKLLNKK